MKSKRPTKIIKDLIDFYLTDKVLLINFLRKEGYTNRQIGDVLSVDPSAISHFIYRHKNIMEDK